jgi:hypothetical protein
VEVSIFKWKSSGCGEIAEKKRKRQGDVLTSVEMRERLNFCPAKTIAKSGRNGAPITLSTTASIALCQKK